MDVRKPAEARRAFETLFCAGDLEGLMELYEPDAVFTNAREVHAGSVAIRNVLQGYLNTGAPIHMNESVAVEGGDLALVHWSWTMVFPDGRTAKGSTAEVLRKSADGTWKFVIDSPDGPALIGHT